MGLLNSAYDEFPNQITVDQAMKDPTMIPQRLAKSLPEEAWVENLFFRKGPANNGVIGFAEDQPEDYDDEGIEDIAEGGEIPIISPEIDDSDIKVAYSVKSGGAFRVTYEQRTENRWDMINKSQSTLQRKMLMRSIRSIERIFDEGDIPEIELPTHWAQGGNLIQDIADGINAVQDAHEDGDPSKRYEYAADTILYHPTVKTTARLNDSMQKYYIGNMADKNPAVRGRYAGLTGFQLFGQLNESESRLINPKHVYIFVEKSAGFTSETIPLTASALYAEGGGDDRLGGKNMRWRSDLVRKRAIALDAPKSVVRLVLP